MSAPKILITHPIHPGQFGALARALCDQGNEVLFLSRFTDPSTPYRMLQYDIAREPTADGDQHLIAPEHAVLIGQAVGRVALELKRSGWEPNLIIGPTGFGELAFLADIFPRAPILGFAEYFYRAYGADVGFDPDTALSEDDLPRVRLKNAVTLASLDICSAAYAPTEWQKQTFPQAYRHKIAVIHDGVDTDVLKPNARARLSLDGASIPAKGRRLVTYAARALEHYRGFHKFWPAMAKVLARNAAAEAVVVGADEPAYSQAGHTSLAGSMVNEFPADLSRTHLAPMLNRPTYIRMLQASHCHVYLTYPFIPSWSLVEAMACGSLVVASDVAPVREIVGDDTSMLVDFFDVEALAKTIEACLFQPDDYQRLRSNARERAVSLFDFKRQSWPRLRALIGDLMR